jgi:hypothetical protein
MEYEHTETDLNFNMKWKQFGIPACYRHNWHTTKIPKQIIFTYICQLEIIF